MPFALAPGDSVGVGTTFRPKWTKCPLVEFPITHCDRPRGWAYVSGGAIAVDLDVTLEGFTTDARLCFGAGSRRADRCVGGRIRRSTMFFGPAMFGGGGLAPSVQACAKSRSCSRLSISSLKR